WAHRSWDRVVLLDHPADGRCGADCRCAWRQGRVAPARVCADAARASRARSGGGAPGGPARGDATFAGPGRPAAPMTLFAWLFARILSLAPPAFRNRYADEALDLSLARLGETHGITRVMRALRELVDAFRTVHVERRAARKVHTSLAATLTSQPRSLTMDAYLRDFRLAVRALLRAPAFSLAAIVTLAVGIGSTALMFTTVDAAFLQPLPFREPNRLAFVWQVTERAPSIRIAGRVWRDWQRVSSFSSLAAIAGTGQ